MGSTESSHWQIPPQRFLSNDAPSGFQADSLASLPFLLVKRTTISFDCFFQCLLWLSQLVMDFSTQQVQLFMELMAGGRKATPLGSTGPDGQHILSPWNSQDAATGAATWYWNGIYKLWGSEHNSQQLFTESLNLKYHRKNRTLHLSKSDFTVGTKFGTWSQKTLGKIFWSWSYQGRWSLIHFPADCIWQEINLRILMLLFTFNQPKSMKKQQLHFLGKQAPSQIRSLFTKSR